MVVIFCKSRSLALLYPKTAAAAAAAAAITGGDVDAVMVSVFSVLFVDLRQNCVFICFAAYYWV